MAEFRLLVVLPLLLMFFPPIITGTASRIIYANLPSGVTMSCSRPRYSECISQQGSPITTRTRPCSITNRCIRNSGTTTFALMNNCQEIIWPAINISTGSTELSSTSIALQSGKSMTFQADVSSGGSIWARTHCTNDSTGANFRCLTGDCGSSTVECSGGIRGQPATVVEFNSDVDFFDVSLVNGFNVPILVGPLGGDGNCITTGCAVDLKADCPSELRMTGKGGEVLGCKSPCEVFGKAEYCCDGTHNSPKACKPNNYSRIFKEKCPDAHTYPFDDNATNTFSCFGAVYTITFCPPPNNSQDPSNLPGSATYVLRPGGSLNSTSKLISVGGTFTLGFFTVPQTNLSYLGIWYTADEQGGKVWVANPNNPIVSMDSETRLAMDSMGNIVLFSGGKALTNVTDQVVSSGKITTALLLDSGNFVLTDSGRGGTRTLWQSFDQPTDKLLPAMKLGFNLTTKQNWTLTSWISSSLPASGAFTLSLEKTQDSGQLVIRKHGVVYWTSGPWKNQGFPSLPRLNDSSNQFVHKINLISANDGMYFTFGTIGTSLSMLTLSPEGQIVDVANNGLLSPSFCYGYEKDNGCASSALPSCRSNKDTFDILSGFVGDNGTSVGHSNISVSDCMEFCWNNCSCNGFTMNINGFGCITWMQNMQFHEDYSGQMVKNYVLAAANKSSKDLTKHRGPWIGRAWIWVVVGILVVILLLLLGFICHAKIKKAKVQEPEQRVREEYTHQLTVSEIFQNVDGMPEQRKEGELNIFSFGSIVAATNNFSGENKLGEGGFGPVYLGRLLDGREIAVKRLSRTSGQGSVEFKNELTLISKLQHTNLVRVLGCCIHGEDRILVYEYMRNKSLDFFLFAKDKEKLDWQKRFDIIEGVAQGLLYLHKYSRMRVIHRDLKASNVLLDENMKPKIADFGMARIFEPNVTEAMTNRIVGTYGYMSPEYAMEGTFSIKSDVFSFGVLILEIVSGKRNSSFYDFEDRTLNLIGYAWELWKGGMALELKDPALWDSKQMLRSIHVGLLCVQESASDRPTMPEVISMLHNESMILADPKQPAFFTGRRSVHNDHHDSNSTERGNEGPNLHVSLNGLSITAIEPR